MAKRNHWFLSVRRGLLYGGVVLLAVSFFLEAAGGLSLRGAPRETSLVGWRCMAESVYALWHPLGWQIMVREPATVLMFVVLLAHPVMLFLPRWDQAAHGSLRGLGLVLIGVSGVNLAIIGPAIVQSPRLGFYVWTAAFALSGVGLFVPGHVGWATRRRAGAPGKPASDNGPPTGSR